MSEISTENAERVLSTLNRDGSRRWMRPRLSRGRFLTARRWLAYGLIALFTLIPFTYINGKPAILLDVARREFTFFGVTFYPTDTLLLALFMVALIVAIFLVTALLGRVWCGWICPQTVYMEFVFRPLERLFDGPPGPGGAAGKKGNPLRTALKFILYVVVSFYLANTFLAYFVGVEALSRWVTQSPFQHPASFLVMLVTTGLMMFDFVFFREQTCIVACPYGRIQSVMLDRDSLIISYDPTRGEPRGRLRKDADPAVRQGDCVDCGLCVETCPTGIDIRQGLQLECIGCAQCIDACDAVMERVHRPRGLIRYSSQRRIAREGSRILRPRVIIYPAILVVLATIFGIVLASRQSADVVLLRGQGTVFTEHDSGEIINMVRVKITNFGKDRAAFSIGVVDLPVRVDTTENPLTIGPGESRTEGVRLIADRALFQQGVRDVKIRISNGADFSSDLPYRLFGPRSGVQRPATQPQESGS